MTSRGVDLHLAGTVGEPSDRPLPDPVVATVDDHLVSSSAQVAENVAALRAASGDPDKGLAHVVADPTPADNGDRVEFGDRSTPAPVGDDGVMDLAGDHARTAIFTSMCPSLTMS
jgi:hypothetical protein